MVVWVERRCYCVFCVMCDNFNIMIFVESECCFCGDVLVCNEYCYFFVYCC